MGATEASDATPACAKARASAASKSSMPCSLWRSEKISRMESVVNRGSSRRAVCFSLTWSKSRRSAGAAIREARYFHGNISLSRRQLYAGFFNCGRLRRRLLCCSALAESRDLVNRAVRLVNRRVGVGESFRVGIRDRDAPKRLPADDARLLILRPIRIDRVNCIRRRSRAASDLP